MSVSESLQRPIGPLAAWQWGVVIAGGYLGYRLLTGKSLFPGGSDATTGPTANFGAPGIDTSGFIGGDSGGSNNDSNGTDSGGVTLPPHTTILPGAIETSGSSTTGTPSRTITPIGTGTNQTVNPLHLPGSSVPGAGNWQPAVFGSYAIAPPSTTVGNSYSGRQAV